MIDTSSTLSPTRSGPLVGQRKALLPRLWHLFALAAILLTSIFMNFYQLGQNGYANLYYASAIRSMLDSWHNFFFVAFDPGGFVTIDKPPLGFWLQAASAKVFGFSPFSIFLPQALAGVLSVLLLYHLLRRHFGVVAGLLAALALAISPISVVTNRNNTIDSTLVLTMLLGAWAVMRAAETGKWRWLLLTAVMVGLGFNIKMLEAYLVVPAFGLLYLLASPRSLRMRLLQLFVAALLMLAISLSWAVAVDLTPASQRPYVGSSQDNSELSLALGYNGIQRLLGSFGFGTSGTRNANTGSSSSTSGTNGTTPPGGATRPGNGNTSANTNENSGQPPQMPANGQSSQGFGGGQPPQGSPGGNGGGNGGGGGGSGMFNTGSAGVLRLFNEPLGGQIVWLLPFALLGIAALAWQRRPHFRVFQQDREQQSLLLWGTWLLTMAIFFSAASFFHQYYLSTLAPAICALFGIGVVIMWRDYWRAGWRGWLLPLALLLTALEQIHIILSDPSWGTWLIPCIAIPCALAGVILIVARLLPRLRFRTRILIPALCLGLMALMLTSAVWSAVPGLENIAADLPTAGPTQSMAGGPGGSAAPGGNANTGSREGPPSQAQSGNGSSNGNSNTSGRGTTTASQPGNGGPAGGTVDTALIKYLEANQGSAKYLVATTSSNEADSIILATNKAVMAMGGFGGSDPILTTSSLATLVSNGTIRYFLLNGSGAGPGGGQSSLTTWITQHCSAVPSTQWETASTTTNSGSTQLYECSATK